MSGSRKKPPAHEVLLRHIEKRATSGLWDAETMAFCNILYEMAIPQDALKSIVARINKIKRLSPKQSMIRDFIGCLIRELEA